MTKGIEMYIQDVQNWEQATRSGIWDEEMENRLSIRNRCFNNHSIAPWQLYWGHA
jgi:hypothetical protein